MKKIYKILMFCSSVLIFIIAFLALQRLVMPKYAGDISEGNYTAEYYKETTNHDVILIGDCEVYENINPMYLWKHFGITSYIRGNAQQLTWQSYYLLEDTLKYETPQIVIYNIQALSHDKPQKEEYNRMTLDGMKWSKTKWNAIQTSICEEESVIDYLFPLLRYHSRIFELEKDDLIWFFDRKKVTHNGYYLRIDVLPVSESDVADPSWLLGDTEETAEIVDPWSAIDDEIKEAEETGERIEKEVNNNDYTFGTLPMEYLDKIRLLCEKHNIELILMKAPSLAPQWHEQENTQVVDYAKKYNLFYINFYELLDTTKIDYETDTYDGGLHMNLSGANKLSKYLGHLLSETYQVTDHRSDPTLSAIYQKKYAYFKSMIKKQKKLLTN